MTDTTLSTLPQLELEIKFYLQQTAQNIIEVGKRLIAAKNLVQHGEWQNWLSANFQLSYRMAAKFMQISERFSNVPLKATLNQTQMIELLALPSGDEEEFIQEKAAEGTPVESMTVKNLREEIKLWKNKDSDNTAEIARLQKQLADAEKPEVVTVEVPTEVVPADYDSTKAELKSKTAEIKKMQAQLEELKAKSIVDDTPLESVSTQDLIKMEQAAIRTRDKYQSQLVILEEKFSDAQKRLDEIQAQLNARKG